MVKDNKPGIIARTLSRFRFADPTGSRGADPLNPLEEILGNGYGNQGGNTAAPAVKPRPGFIDNYFIHKTPVGSMGTESYAGYPREEYLHELFGKDRAKIFDKMRRSDTQCTMLLGAVKDPIKAAVWEVEPANPDDPEDVRRADVIRHILLEDMPPVLENGEIKVTGFAKFLEEALSVCDFGHVAFEKTYRLVKNHPKYGFYHGIAGLDHINPKTIERWNLSPRGGLKSITQLAFGDLRKFINIPAQFLMVAALNQEGANYEGVSLLRPCYGAWLRKNLILKLNIIGAERYAVRTPIAKIPAGFQNTEQYGFLIQVLEAYTSGEAAYMTIPQSVELELSENAYDPEKMDSAADAEDRRMAKAFKANFLELGMNGTGSFAMSEDLSDFFLAGIEHVAHKVRDMVNMFLIPELCNLNFGPLPAYPKLKVSGISDKAGKELAEVLHYLVSANVLEPDDPLEEQMRKRYGLSKKSVLGKRQAPVGPNAGFIGPDGQVVVPGQPDDPNAEPGAKPGGKPGKPGGKFSESLTQRVRRRLYGGRF